MKFSIHHGLLVVAVASTLQGCGVQDENVRGELKAIAAHYTPKIKALPLPEPYEAFAYEVESLPDPFATAKVTSKIRPSVGAQPDMKRAKEALEAFPLETIHMVGTVQIGNILHGVVNADGYLYRVRIGQFIGQNYGRVKSISEREIILSEMFQEANDEWTQRETALSLSESTEVKKK